MCDRNGRTDNFTVAKRIYLKKVIGHFDGKVTGVSGVCWDFKLIRMVALLDIEGNHFCDISDENHFTCANQGLPAQDALNKCLERQNATPLISQNETLNEDVGAMTCDFQKGGTVQILQSEFQRLCGDDI